MGLVIQSRPRSVGSQSYQHLDSLQKLSAPFGGITSLKKFLLLFLIVYKFRIFTVKQLNKKEYQFIMYNILIQYCLTHWPEHTVQNLLRLLHLLEIRPQVVQILFSDFPQQYFGRPNFYQEFNGTIVVVNSLMMRSELYFSHLGLHCLP